MQSFFFFFFFPVCLFLVWITSNPKEKCQWVCWDSFELEHVLELLLTAFGDQSSVMPHLPTHLQHAARDKFSWCWLVLLRQGFLLWTDCTRSLLIQEGMKEEELSFLQTILEQKIPLLFSVCYYYSTVKNRRSFLAALPATSFTLFSSVSLCPLYFFLAALCYVQPLSLFSSTLSPRQSDLTAFFCLFFLANIDIILFSSQGFCICQCWHVLASHKPPCRASSW